MKKLAVILISLASIAFFTPRNARAQSIDGTKLALALAEGAAITGGVVTGIGSTVQASRGRTSRGVFAASYVFGVLNAVPAVIWGVATADDPGELSVGLMLAHGSVAVWNLIAPTVGFARGSDVARGGDGPYLSPVALGGTD